MQLLLVRHGESAGNVTRVLQGPDEKLTERGRRQAGALASALSARGDVGVIYASPLVRASETASIIGNAIGVEVQPRAHLAEVNVGDRVGITIEAWSEQFPDEVQRWKREGIDFVWPGGESGRQLGARTANEIDWIMDTHRHEDGAVVVVSHGGALAWIVSHLLGEVRDAWPEHEFANCSLTEVTVDANGGALMFVCHNEVGHLSTVADEEVATGQV